jgi:hypothetical protein
MQMSLKSESNDARKNSIKMKNRFKYKWKDQTDVVVLQPSPEL